MSQTQIQILSGMLVLLIIVMSVLTWLALKKPAKKKAPIASTKYIRYTGVYTALAIAVQLLGIALAVFIAFAFICEWLPVAPWVKISSSLAIGIIGWSKMLFDTPKLKHSLYSYWFVYNPPLIACVVGQALSDDRRLEELSGPLGTCDVSTLREIGPGWHGKLPTEAIYKHVSLSAYILIGNSIEKDGTPLVLTSSDGIPIACGWLARLTALRGYLVHTVLYSYESQIQEFRAKFVRFLLGWATTKKAAVIYSMMEEKNTAELEEQFKLVLGGKDAIHPFEAERGMFSGDPEFNGLTYEKKYQDALQAKMLAARADEASAVLYRSHQDAGTASRLDPNLVMLTGASMAGIEVAEPIVITGNTGEIDPATIAAARDLKKQKKGK